MRRSRIVPAVLLALVLAWWWFFDRAPPTPPPEPPAPPALARLARGVNLSNWLQHGPPAEAARYAPDAGDWRRIRALGLTHVRLPVNPSALPDDAALAALRAAIQAAHAEDLLVVLAVQLPPEAKAQLGASGEARDALAAQWRRIAGALRDLPPTHLAFEPLNEPELADAASSRELQAVLVAVLRVAVPFHTMVVSGHRYSGVDELAALRPLADANVVYGFHFYEPHNFTHQGANWGDLKWAMLSNFPYPSSPEAVAPLLAAAPDAARDLLRWHGEERWNRERIRARLATAAQWAREHRVPVWCSEFGVLKIHAGAAERAAWLADVRTALEDDGIPWTHWDYAGPFGIVDGPGGARTEDTVAIEALGLKR